MPDEDDDLLGSALDDALRAVRRRPGLYDIADAVNRAVLSAVDMVPGADVGGISIQSPNVSGAHGSTSEPAADLDALQHRFDEGPCLSALTGPRPETKVVIAQDVAYEDAWRWPRFGPAAAALGFPAVLSLQLPAAPGVGAALNLYSRAPEGFAPPDLIFADTFVRHLAHLLFGTFAGPAPAEVPTERRGPRAEQELRRRLDRPVLEP